MNVNEECLLNFLSNPEEINDIFKAMIAISPDALRTAESLWQTTNFSPNVVL